jgi:hypothetical protein
MESFAVYVGYRPADARGWCNLGIARASLALNPQAIEALNKAVEIDKTLVPAWNQLAQVHAEVFSNTREPASRQAAIECVNRSLSLVANQPEMQEFRKSIESAAAMPAVSGEAQ